MKLTYQVGAPNGTEHRLFLFRLPPSLVSSTLFSFFAKVCVCLCVVGGRDKGFFVWCFSPEKYCTAGWMSARSTASLLLFVLRSSCSFQVGKKKGCTCAGGVWSVCGLFRGRWGGCCACTRLGEDCD